MRKYWFYGVHAAYNFEGNGKYVVHDKVEDDSAAFTAMVNASKEKAKEAKEKRAKKKLLQEQDGLEGQDEVLGEETDDDDEEDDES